MNLRLLPSLLILFTLLTLNSAHAQNSTAPYAVPMQMTEEYDVPSQEEVDRARREIEAQFHDAKQPTFFTKQQKALILQRYNHIDTLREVPTDLLEKALLYFDANKAKFPNQEYITIVDFKPRSDRYRLYLINVKSGAVEKYHTTHGLNSDTNRDGVAEIFGNVINSGKSSLGFVRVSEVYSGKFKRSLRLDGLSKTNSNIRARAVVLHGWDGVREENVIQGLSWGCITLDWTVKDSVIDRVKEGSLMYVGVSTRKKKK